MPAGQPKRLDVNEKSANQRSDPKGFGVNLEGGKGSDVYLFVFSRSENTKSKRLTPVGSLTYFTISHKFVMGCDIFRQGSGK
jgi:hypothetical protein